MTTIEAPLGRPPLLAHAGGAVVVCAALMGLAYGGVLPLALGVGLLQVLLVLGFLALVDAPAALGVFVLGSLAAVATDVVAGVDDGHVGGLAGVTALAFVAGLLQQLARRDRSRVTESLSDTLVVVVLVASAACLPAAVQLHHGEAVVRSGLLAVGAALAAGRLTDRVLPRARIAPTASRGWPGLLLALVVGAALAVPEAGDALTLRQALLVGLAAAATAVTADLFVDLAAADVVHDERRRVSMRPVGLLLPFAVVAPVLLVATRLLEQA